MSKQALDPEHTRKRLAGFFNVDISQVTCEALISIVSDQEIVVLPKDKI